MKISKFSVFIVHMFDNIIQLRRDYPYPWNIHGPMVKYIELSTAWLTYVMCVWYCSIENE